MATRSSNKSAPKSRGLIGSPQTEPPPKGRELFNRATVIVGLAIALISAVFALIPIWDKVEPYYRSWSFIPFVVLIVIGLIGGAAGMIAVSVVSFDGLAAFYNRRTDRGRYWVIKGTLFLLSFTVFCLAGSAAFSVSSQDDAMVAARPLKTRVVILLPLGEAIKPAYQDGMRQMYGFAEYLTANNSRYTNDYEFVPINHDMNVETARNLIKSEISNGTKYFISTMSKVNEPLSEQFEELVKEVAPEGESPILICTVTSSPKIRIKKNLIYRFYIRSQEEGKILAGHAKELDAKSVTYIVVADAYGRGAYQQFKHFWGDREFTEGVELTLASDMEEIQKRIKTKFDSLPPHKKEFIFVAHYGNGIDNILRALANLKIKATILSTSPITIEDWQEPIRDVLQQYEWFTCAPDYKPDDQTKTDVIKNFTTHTIDKLVQTLNRLRSKQNKDFDEAWNEPSPELNLAVDWNGGDSVIPLRIKSKKDFGFK